MAAGFAVALSATVAVPAYADPASASRPAAPRLSVQSLAVGSAATGADLRDSYRSSPLRSGLVPYSRWAPTFVNDPTSPIQWPFTQGAPITSYFGARVAPCRGCSTNHSGIDIAPGLGTPVGAIADGVVTKTGGPGGELGVYATVEHVIGGERVTSIYAHMLGGSLNVKVGDRVTVGQTVGLVGNTGQSTGPHLHLSILRAGQYVDPFAYLTERVGR